MYSYYTEMYATRRRGKSVTLVCGYYLDTQRRSVITENWKWKQPTLYWASNRANIGWIVWVSLVTVSIDNNSQRTTEWCRLWHRNIRMENLYC